jgi:hypothetical protein
MASTRYIMWWMDAAGTSSAGTLHTVCGVVDDVARTSGPVHYVRMTWRGPVHYVENAVHYVVDAVHYRRGEHPVHYEVDDAASTVTTV